MSFTPKPSDTSPGPAAYEQFPPEVAFEWVVEDLIAAARLDPSILDQDAVKDTADRLIDAIGARQERLFQ